MSTFTSVSWSVSLMIGTWGQGKESIQKGKWAQSTGHDSSLTTWHKHVKSLVRTKHKFQTRLCGFSKLKTKKKTLLVTYSSFVEDLNGIWPRHIAFSQGTFQFLQWGMVPVSKHHQVNVTENRNKVLCTLTSVFFYRFTMNTQWCRGHWNHNTWSLVLCCATISGFWGKAVQSQCEIWKIKNTIWKEEKKVTRSSIINIEKHSLN